MDDDRDPLTGLTDRERIARHELLLGALLAILVDRGALTAGDVDRILSIGVSRGDSGFSLDHTRTTPGPHEAPRQEGK